MKRPEPGKVYLCVDQRDFDGALQVQICDENGGYRIAGAKYDGSGKTLIKRLLDERDVREIQAYLTNAAAENSIQEEKK